MINILLIISLLVFIVIAIMMAFIIFCTCGIVHKIYRIVKHTVVKIKFRIVK